MELLPRVGIAVAVSVILNLLFQYSPKRRHKQSNELKYPLGFLVLGVGCLTIAGLAAASIISGGEPVSAGLVGGAFAAMGVYASLEMRVRLIVFPQAFHLFSPWRSDVVVSWPEITRFRYSVLNRWFIVETRTARYRVSTYLVGFISLFLDTVIKHVDEPIWKNAVDSYLAAGPGRPPSVTSRRTNH